MQNILLFRCFLHSVHQTQLLFVYYNIALELAVAEWKLFSFSKKQLTPSVLHFSPLLILDAVTFAFTFMNKKFNYCWPFRWLIQVRWFYLYTSEILTSAADIHLWITKWVVKVVVIKPPCCLFLQPEGVFPQNICHIFVFSTLISEDIQ